MTPTGGSGPVERIRAVVPVIPCGGCIHRNVCVIRPRLEALRFEAPVSPDEALTVTVSAKVTCEQARSDRGARGPALRAAWTPERREAQAARLRAQRARGKM